MNGHEMRADAAVSLLAGVADCAESLKARREVVLHEPRPVAHAALVAEPGFVNGSAVVDMVQVVEVGNLFSEAASLAAAAEPHTTGVVKEHPEPKFAMASASPAVVPVLARAAPEAAGSVALPPALGTSSIPYQPRSCVAKSLSVRHSAGLSAVESPTVPCLSDLLTLRLTLLRSPRLRHRCGIVRGLHDYYGESSESAIPSNGRG